MIRLIRLEDVEKSPKLQPLLHLWTNQFYLCPGQNKKMQTLLIGRRSKINSFVEAGHYFFSRICALE